ncbi:MAG: ATP-dependent Clp protease proteolytic subunit, partial [Bacteroidota bacterium]
MSEDTHPEQIALWVAERKLTEEKLRMTKTAHKRSKLEFERLQKLDDMEQLSNFNHRLYPYTTEVSNSSVKACIEALTTWFRESTDEPVTIVFDSPGGSVFAGLSLYDTIRALRGT